jgi:hypothetical protein
MPFEKKKPYSTTSVGIVRKKATPIEVHHLNIHNEK